MRLISTNFTSKPTCCEARTVIALITVSFEPPEVLAERARKTRPDQVAILATFLVSDAAKDFSGQILGSRGNEVYLYNQPRPIRTMHKGEGWTPDTMAEILPGALKASLTPLERTRDVYAWEAI